MARTYEQPFLFLLALLAGVSHHFPSSHFNPFSGQTILGASTSLKGTKPQGECFLGINKGMVHFDVCFLISDIIYENTI